MKWLIRGQNISVSAVMELFIQMSRYALTVVFGTSFLGRKQMLDDMEVNNEPFVKR